MNKEIIDHMMTGYNNMQAVVARMDTKATIINAGLALLLAYVVALGKWLVDIIGVLSTQYPLSIVGSVLAAALLLLSIFFIYRSFIHNSKIWFPNHSLLEKNKFSSLFPEWDGSAIDEDFVSAHYDKLIEARDISPQEEVKRQCVVMGQIVYNKILNAQKAQSTLVTSALCALLASCAPFCAKVYALTF